MKVVSHWQFFHWRPNIISNFSINTSFIIMATKNYLCPVCRKKLKLIYRLTRHMNMCTSHQVFPIRMQPKQDTPIPGEDENASKNIRPHEDEKSILEKQDIEKDHRNLGSKSSNTGSRVKDGLSRCIPQIGLLGNESLSSLREIWFSDQEFAAGISESNIKYNHSGF